MSKKTPKQAKSQSSQKSRDTYSAKNFWTDRTRLLILLGILVISAIAYWPARDTQLVNWDDDRNIYDNPLIEDLSFNGLKEIFTEDIIGNYNPLTILSFAIERKIYGAEVISAKKAYPFVVVNVLLHLLCIYLVFRIGIEMKLKQWALLFSTVLFALHPMRVESISWATERKDVLYGAFFFASLLYYVLRLRYKEERFLYIALALMIPACLAKIQAVSLPLAMLAFDFYFRRKIRLKLLIEKIPFFALSIATGLVGVYMLKKFGSLEQTTTSYGFGQRLLIGSYSLVVYLIKSIVPYEMVALYPYPPRLGWQFPASLIGSLAFFGLSVLAFLRRWRLVFCGLTFFFVNVVFLLQILAAGQGFIADRFTYVAYLGLFWIYGLVLQTVIDLKPSFKIPLLVVALCVSGVYGFLGFRQKAAWNNSQTLWTTVLKKYDRTPLPYRNRGNHFRDTGQNDLALQDYSSAIRLEPNNHQHYNSRGKLYFTAKRHNEAISDYSRALELSPGDASYWANRGAAYAQAGRLQEALKDLNQCLSLDPNYLTGLLNRSLIHRQLGRPQDALRDVTSYLGINPRNIGMWIEKSNLLSQLGRHQQVLESLNQAIAISPSTGRLFALRAQTMLNLGNADAARRDVQKAQSLGHQVNQNLLQRIR